MTKKNNKKTAPINVEPVNQEPIDVNDFIRSLPEDKQETAMQLMFAVEQSTSFKVS